uniref:3-methyl-2-oxobutanoate hydroxymethyltransferase n=1 Tax=uncultured Spirochaetales bacterium HF0500_06B09 TaxID=710994 RepID=E0XY82_9SPIR|nr:ketopantoate hydroxymethyltransferase [uncultured Spirochaetales bacterium HF0500_06B09]
MERHRVTLTDLTLAEREPLVMVTAYDASSARLTDSAGVDLILVGDTLAEFALGYDSTTPVTVNEMLHHCQAVTRIRPRALVVGDMPLGSYQVSTEEAVRNAIRFVKEGGVDAVKIEGGRVRGETIRAIAEAGIAVMGHIGFTPQSAVSFGSQIVAGRDVQGAMELYRDAFALQEAGCFAIVIEAVARAVASRITAELAIPTIGIGSGAGCSGQVLVFHELTGIHPGPSPRFVHRYGEAGIAIQQAISFFARDVRSGAYPDKEHSYLMPTEEITRFEHAITSERRNTPFRSKSA